MGLGSSCSICARVARKVPGSSPARAARGAPSPRRTSRPAAGGRTPVLNQSGARPPSSIRMPRPPTTNGATSRTSTMCIGSAPTRRSCRSTTSRPRWAEIPVPRPTGCCSTASGDSCWRTTPTVVRLGFTRRTSTIPAGAPSLSRAAGNSRATTTRTSPTSTTPGGAGNTRPRLPHPPSTIRSDRIAAPSRCLRGGRSGRCGCPSRGSNRRSTSGSTATTSATARTASRRTSST